MNRKLKRLIGVALGLFIAGGALAACDPVPAPPCIYACWLAQPGNVWTPPTTAAPAPVVVPVYVPPPVPVYVPPPPPQPILSNYWDPSEPPGATACISVDIAQEWATDVANPNNVWVVLYHGSIDNGTQIKVYGLSLYMNDGDVPGATYVTRDYNAAHDAVWNPNHYPSGGVYDRWIVGSKMPYYIWQHYFEPYERPYTGWYPYTLQSTETLLTNNIQLGIFNYGIYNWGYSL